MQSFEKKGLIYELPTAAVKLVDIGKVENGGDYVVAGCMDGSLQLYDLSHSFVCLLNTISTHFLHIGITDSDNTLLTALQVKF